MDVETQKYLSTNIDFASGFFLRSSRTSTVNVTEVLPNLFRVKLAYIVVYRYRYKTGRIVPIVISIIQTQTSKHNNDSLVHYCTLVFSLHSFICCCIVDSFLVDCLHYKIFFSLEDLLHQIDNGRATGQAAKWNSEPSILGGRTSRNDCNWFWSEICLWLSSWVFIHWPIHFINCTVHPGVVL